MLDMVRKRSVVRWQSILAGYAVLLRILTHCRDQWIRPKPQSLLPCGRDDGGKHLAVENPSYTQWEFAKVAGLKLVPIAVDENGVDVKAVAASKADAIIVTPTHQSPTGHALSGERRTALLRVVEGAQNVRARRRL